MNNSYLYQNFIIEITQLWDIQDSIKILKYLCKYKYRIFVIPFSVIPSHIYKNNNHKYILNFHPVFLFYYNNVLKIVNVDLCRDTLLHD